MGTTRAERVGDTERLHLSAAESERRMVAERAASERGEETCDTCGEECGADAVRVPIGGGTGDLCASCAARLCDCGAYVLKVGEAVYYDALANETHRTTHCTHPFAGSHAIGARIPSRTWGRS
jgi:hypothetical protein